MCRGEQEDQREQSDSKFKINDLIWWSIRLSQLHNALQRATDKLAQKKETLWIRNGIWVN